MPLDWEDIQRRLADAIGPIEGDDPKQRKRARILQAATALFVRQGYRKTSVDEIASAAGVAKGSVYLHFGNKAEILWVALAIEKRENIQQAKFLFTEPLPPRERLQRWLATTLVMSTRMPLVTKLLQGDRDLATALEDMPPELMGDNEEAGEAFIGAMVQAAIAPATLSDAALHERVCVLRGIPFLAGHLMDPRMRGDLSPERFAEVLSEMIVSGIVPPTEDDEENDDG